MKPRGRPHLKQRRTVREENFGTRFAFIIIDFFAMKFSRVRRLKLLHPTFRMLGYESFAWLCSCDIGPGPIRPKNKAPYEAKEIYAR